MNRHQLKRNVIAGLVGSALGFSLAGPLSAADQYGSESKAPSAAMDKGKSTQPSSAYDMRASKVIGMKVQGSDGESLGKINDLVVDVKNERITYAVLSFGGMLGLGEKLFAYPLSVFQPTAGRDQLVLNVDKDKLKNAPGFEGRNWPDWNAQTYRGDVDRYFGPTASPKAMPNQHLVRASELIGKNVDDKTGRRAGEIGDLVVNVGNAKVRYVVLDFDKAWSVRDQLLPLSLKAFAFPADRKDDIVLNVGKDQLDMSVAFDANKWPDVGDPTYQRNIDNYLVRSARTGRSATGQAGPVRE